MGWGEGTALHWKHNFKGFIENNTSVTPATWNWCTYSLSLSSGEDGECLIPHTCSLLQCKLTQGLGWSGPEVDPSSGAGSWPSGGARA